jgi:hypothetical protein
MVTRILKLKGIEPNGYIFLNELVEKPGAEKVNEYVISHKHV